MKYNKLIRDKIPEILRKKGAPFKTHSANDDEFWQKLKEKLLEEVREFQKDESTEELADILEVLEAIGKYKNFSEEAVQAVKKRKAEARGVFDQRIILEES